MRIFMNNLMIYFIYLKLLQACYTKSLKLLELVDEMTKYQIVFYFQEYVWKNCMESQKPWNTIEYHKVESSGVVMWPRFSIIEIETRYLFR
jgi:hypothetical protein